MAPSVEVMNMTAANQFNDDPLIVGVSGGPSALDTSSAALAAAAGVASSNGSSPVGAGTESSSSSTNNNNNSNNGGEITRPGEHDVLLGRGGGTNNHSGNIKFRKLVNEHKMRYLACSKVDKPKVAREVVQLWRKMTPPGRFLARRDDTKRGPGSVKAADNVWYEVGDKKAREKASQCLRERTPDVMPYIKQLREQQDAITEHGVSLVQQQLQMQQQHHHHHHHPHQSPHRAHQQQQHPNQQHHQHQVAAAAARGLISPQQQASGYVDFGANSRSPMGTQPFPGRRASMPGPPDPSLMGHQQQQQQQLNQQQRQQQQQQQMFNRSPQAVAAFGNSNNSTPNRSVGGMMMNQQQLMAAAAAGQQPMNDFYAPQLDHEPVPFGNNSSNNNGNNNNNGGNDMSEMEYQQNMMMMQQQVQMQQMQMRQMQQQQRQLQQQQQLEQQQRLPNGAYAAFNDDEEDDLDPFPVQSDPLMGLPADGFPQQQQQQQHPESTSDGASTPPPRQQSARSPSSSPPPAAAAAVSPTAGGGASSSLPPKSPNKRGRDEPPERVAPDRAPTSTSLMSYTPVDIDTTDPTGDGAGEMTIEEYRKQLEAYIENIENNNNNSNNSGNNNNNDGAAFNHHDGDDDDYASDLEDDWEKEREKNMRSTSHSGGGHNNKQRGVGRNTSGLSFMSAKTTKTNMSMISGISASLFSDLGSETGASATTREQKMNAGRSVCSNLSLMSELTDLSENIDKLGLDDD